MLNFFRIIFSFLFFIHLAGPACAQVAGANAFLISPSVPRNNSFSSISLGSGLFAAGNYGPNQTPQALSFEYFANGNLKKKDNLDYVYDPNRIKPHAVRSIGAESYGYDDNGNMETKTSGGTVTTYFYDTENRLEGVQVGSNIVGEYAYDSAGRRIAKGTSSEVVHFAGDIFENTSGSGYRKFVFTEGQRVAGNWGGVTRFYHPDHLGGTNVMTSPAGLVIERTEYKPFGEFGSFETSTPLGA